MKKEKSNNTGIDIIYIQWDINGDNLEIIQGDIAKKLNNLKTKKLIINIKELNYINSVAIWYFADMLNKFNNKWKMFVFAEPNENIIDILNLVNMPSLINIYDTNEEAMLFFEK